ncbi:DUF192 domain-containing protein [Vacuolonema iberomarrocanum]|uniref:DUF192 domain-containing protein n=1 Tax=Vacuolonema iberomarrocanum TaxID=3454632 RepID=UPI003F6E3F4C
MNPLFHLSSIRRPMIRRSMIRRPMKWAIPGAIALSLSAVLLSCSTPSAVSSDAPTPVAVENQGQQLPITAETEINGETIQLEVARTRSELSTGLMFRPSLEDDRGMLFVFERPRVLQFWMKNVLIPLDMVFLRDGEVQAIVTAPPCENDPCPSYGPSDRQSDSVIELRGGRAAELGLSEGDRVEIRFLEEAEG